MTPDELKERVRALVDEDLNLEDGEMMMPLKQHEIDSLEQGIRELAERVAREGLSR